VIIFSFKDFYFGIDSISAYYMDVQVHFGIFRLEFGGTPPLNIGSDTDSSNRCSDGTYSPRIRDAAVEGP